MNKKKPKLITEILNNKKINKKLQFLVKKSKIIYFLNKKIKKILPKTIKWKCKILNFTKESIFIETLNINSKLYIQNNKKKILKKIKNINIKKIYIKINPNLNN